MSLPVEPPLPPMEARIAAELPRGTDWQYEPKWDGFRCIAFRDGTQVELQSKASKPLTRYFPEVVAAVGALAPRRFVLDGELVIPVKGTLSFDDLLQRIHPAQSRIQRLAKDFPAVLIVFDLLMDERGRSLLDRPLSERRPLLEAFAKKYLERGGGIRLSPSTESLAVAVRWFRRVGGALDGVVAKRLDLPYQSGNREGMLKVKHRRTADCVVGGFRYGTKAATVGSLLLGLYDETGLLHHVGFTSGMKATEKKALTRKLEAMREPPGFTGRAPGGPSRWSSERSGEWEPLRPELVVEVEYDHFTGGRFRHGTRFVRWRPDKAPRQCTMEQLSGEGVSPLALLQ